MRYRRIGKAALEVSELALGCEGLIKGDEMAGLLLRAAVDKGINFLDMYSPAPVFRDLVGSMLEHLPRPLVLQTHLCAVWKDEQYLRTRDLEAVKHGFEDLLSRLGTDRVDIGMIHYVDAVSDWNEVETGGILEYAKSLKDAGAIGLIGVSSHNPEAARAAIETGQIDVLMFAVNPCYDLQPPTEDVEQIWAETSYAEPLVNMDPEREALYLECQRRGVGITVMKAFGGGDLLKAEDSPAGVALSENACLQYALTRPGVCSVLAGVHSQSELDDLLAFEEIEASEVDYAAELAAFPKIKWSGHCMYCGHCAPCPQKIDVAQVEKFYHLAAGKPEIPETVREHYGALAAKAGDCISCGACEKRCPFEVHVIEDMQKTKDLFGC